MSVQLTHNGESWCPLTVCHRALLRDSDSRLLKEIDHSGCLALYSFNILDTAILKAVVDWDFGLGGSAPPATKMLPLSARVAPLTDIALLPPMWNSSHRMRRDEAFIVLRLHFIYGSQKEFPCSRKPIIFNGSWVLINSHSSLSHPKAAIISQVVKEVGR